LGNEEDLGVIVMKFDRAGRAVTSFGDRGGAKLVVRSNFSARAIAVSDDGKVIVAGTVPVSGGVGARVRLYRLTGGGAYDGSFGTGAISEFQIGSRSSKTPVLFDAVAGIATTHDGGILVGGGSVAYAPPAGFGSATFAVAKLTSAGVLEPSYGVGGIAQTVYASGADV